MSRTRRSAPRGAGRRVAGSWGAAALLLTAGAATAESPDVLYMLHCQGCHLPDGRGAPGAVPSLVDSVARFVRVPEGRAFLVQVPGSAASRLGDADLAAVLNWMLARFGPAQDARAAAPYTAEEVGRLRATPLTEVDAVRRRLVDRLGEAAP